MRLPVGQSSSASQVEAALGDYQYGYRELVVRCNALETEWGLDDLRTFATAPISALLFPKIESSKQISRYKEGTGGARVNFAPVDHDRNRKRRLNLQQVAPILP